MKENKLPNISLTRLALLLVSAAGIYLTCSNLQAQNFGGTSGAVPAQAQDALSSYLGGSQATQQGLNLLDKALVNGLPRTSQNTQALRATLVSRVPASERAQIARLLAAQYDAGNPTGLNLTILQDLKTAAASDEPEVARAALLAFSRLGYFDDYEAVLQIGRDRGLIDADVFWGEHAHILPFAPLSRQQQLAGKLSASNNEYASLIVAMTVNNRPVAAKLNPMALMELMSMLERSEPQFSSARGQFDFVEAVRYAAWLRAIASLKSTKADAQGTDFIMSKLSDATTEPRKVIAFMISEFSGDFLGSVGQRQRFDPIVQRISTYSRQFPQNKDMKDAVEQIRQTIASLP